MGTRSVIQRFETGRERESAVNGRKKVAEAVEMTVDVTPKR